MQFFLWEQHPKMKSLKIKYKLKNSDIKKKCKFILRGQFFIKSHLLGWGNRLTCVDKHNEGYFDTKSCNKFKA